MKNKLRSGLKEMLLDLFLIMASAYLTYLANACAGDTYLNTPLVFFCAAVMCGLAVYGFYLLQKKYPEFWKTSAAVWFFSAVAAALLLTALQDTLLSRQPEIMISMEAVSANGSSAWENVLLVGAVADGADIPISEITVMGNQNWSYREERDDYIFNAENTAASPYENILSLRFAAKEVTLRFAHNEHQGRVRILDSAGNSAEYDLYAEGFDSAPVECGFTAPAAFSLPERLIYNAGCYLILLFIIAVLFSMKPIEKLLHVRFGMPVCITAAFFILFFTSPKIDLSRFQTVLATYFTAAACRKIPERMDAFLEEYRSKLRFFTVASIALYNAAVIFGRTFFLTGAAEIHLTAEGLFYVLMGTIWMIPLVNLSLFWLPQLAAYLGHPTEISDLNTISGVFRCLFLMIACGYLTNLPGPRLAVGLSTRLLVFELLTVVFAFFLLLRTGLEKAGELPKLRVLPILTALFLLITLHRAMIPRTEGGTVDLADGLNLAAMFLSFWFLLSIAQPVLGTLRPRWHKNI